MWAARKCCARRGTSEAWAGWHSSASAAWAWSRTRRDGACRSRTAWPRQRMDERVDTVVRFDRVRSARAPLPSRRTPWSAFGRPRSAATRVARSNSSPSTAANSITWRTSAPSPATRAASVSPIEAGTREGCGGPKRRPAAQVGPQLAKKNGLPPVRSRSNAAGALASPTDSPLRSSEYSAMASVSSPLRSSRRTPSRRCNSATQAADLLGAVRCGRAERRHHQEAAVGRGLHHMLEQRQRRKLRPVEILQDQRQRSVLRQGPEQPGDRIEQIAANLTSVARPGWSRERSCRTTCIDNRRSPGPPDSMAPASVPAGRSRRDGRASRRRAGTGRQHRGSTRRQHRHAVVPECASHLSDQAGLASSRFATDEEHLSAAPATSPHKLSSVSSSGRRPTRGSCLEAASRGGNGGTAHDIMGTCRSGFPDRCDAPLGRTRSVTSTIASAGSPAREAARRIASASAPRTGNRFCACQPKETSRANARLPRR